MIFLDLRQRVSDSIRCFIENSDNCNIVSVYGIGSLAKDKAKINDIDLNVFVSNSKYETILYITSFQEFLVNELGRSVDFNIIDMDVVTDGFINSDLFPHKNRHSLFLYELVQVECHLYGEKVLQEYIYENKDIQTEALKLLLTLVQRANKEILTKFTLNTRKNIRKFARYAIEFSLINKGYMNPYIGLTP
ncbi:TPA_asm: hypothetical protein GYP34_14620, partial [Listeria monocytogenes]|nr:hypothetical protein [Listeria monocytogenes]